jgi:rhomboid protease GluP
MERAFRNLPRKKADLILLILASQDIKARAEKKEAPQSLPLQFDILVPEKEVGLAVKSVDKYFRENKFFRLPNKIQGVKISSFKSPATFVIMGLMFCIHLVCLELNIQREMILKFGASSLYISQGETFRAITALFLHSDGGHLLGNLAGLIIFAAPMISLSGYGTGPLLLLFAGSSGNLINAYFHQNALLSIGASTAIMGAAGALAAYQMLRPVVLAPSAHPLNRLVPLFAGATLMGLFSQGENTDLSAHVFGFMAGCFWGTLFFPLYRVLCLTFPRRLMEPLALVLTICILGSAIGSAN